MTSTAVARPADTGPHARRQQRRLDRAWLVVIALTAVALILRLHDLGRLGLIADEGHQALAVEGVLATGVPLVPSGNIYLRGGPFIYCEALVCALSGVTEWGLRLPAAIFGALAVILVFIYSRMLFGRRTGLIAAFLMAFSVWELSLSRYARMYTLLALAFLAFAAAFYRGYLAGGSRRDRWLAFLAGAVAVATHQLGIFALLFYAVPLFVSPPAATSPDRSPRRTLSLLLPVIALAILWFGFHRYEARLLMRETPSVPSATATVEADGPAARLVKTYLLVPPVLLPLEIRAEDPGIVLGAALLAAVAAAAIILALRRPGRRLRALWALGIVAAAFLNLIGLALGLVLAYMILLRGGRRDLGKRPLGPALAATLILAGYWLLYVILHPQLLETSWGARRSTADVLLGYPPVAERALSWFIQAWPIPSLLVGITIVVLLVRFAADRRRGGDLFAVAALLLPLLAITATREIHNESRYHFHLYPFIVTLLAAALAVAGRAIGAILDVGAALLGHAFRFRPLVEGALVVALAVLISPDLAPRQIATVVGGDYATPRDPIRSILSWEPYARFHQDHKDPAAFVAARLTAGDRVLVVGPPYWSSIYDYYMGQVDYVVSERTEDFGGWIPVRHHITGARRVVTLADLEQILAAERGHRLWVFSDLNVLAPDNSYFSPDMKARLLEIAAPPVHLGRDGVTCVAVHTAAGTETVTEDGPTR